MKPALELAIDNYQRLRDEAAAELLNAQKSLSAHRQTLSTLENYRLEQQQRRRISGESSRRVSALSLETRFAGTIENAIDQQRTLVHQAVMRVEHLRQALLGCQKRLKAVEMIVRQRAQRMAQRAARQERLATDEQAAIRHLQRTRALATASHPHENHEGIIT
ncbi:MAG: flagellar export protein FliJ [Lautropia sp.]|nr:flagellar export protein FliJ [Lautropia sp.]